jgi:hypothetical protein
MKKSGGLIAQQSVAAALRAGIVNNPALRLALAPYPASGGADSGRLKRAWLAGALGKLPSATSATLGTLGDMARQFE